MLFIWYCIPDFSYTNNFSLNLIVNYINQIEISNTYYDKGRILYNIKIYSGTSQTSDTEGGTVGNSEQGVTGTLNIWKPNDSTYDGTYNDNRNYYRNL